jgi:hypothetical protein
MLRIGLSLGLSQARPAPIFISAPDAGDQAVNPDDSDMFNPDASDTLNPPAGELPT